MFEVTGFPMALSILLMGLCGIFYTSLGGIRAVVWTDFLQGVMMYGGILIIILKVHALSSEKIIKFSNARIIIEDRLNVLFR